MVHRTSPPVRTKTSYTAAERFPVRVGVELCCERRKGVDVADKSPRKTASKKSGKTLKEKRQAKKEKEQDRKGIGR